MGTTVVLLDSEITLIEKALDALWLQAERNGDGHILEYIKAFASGNDFLEPYYKNLLKDIGEAPEVKEMDFDSFRDMYQELGIRERENL